MKNKKLGKAPAFQFYAGDFLSDINVTTMTMAQRGMYITLLAFEWIEGSLPMDLLKLRILCGNHPDFDSDWQIVSNCFTQRDSRLYNNRLETERGNMIAYREKMSANGKKGAETRWQSHGKAIAKPSNKEVEEEIIVKSKRVNLKNDFTNEFVNEFWVLYPRTDNRKRALDKYIATRKSGVKKDVIIDGLKNYIKYWKSKGTEPQYIPMASTWLNQERYGDELMFGNNGVQDIKLNIKQDWMCLECGHEKTTDTKELKNQICEKCKEGRYETKKMALLEKELIERDRKARMKPVVTNVTIPVKPAVQASTSTTSEAGNAAAKEDSSTKLSDIIQRLGV